MLVYIEDVIHANYNNHHHHIGLVVGTCGDEIIARVEKESGHLLLI